MSVRMQLIVTHHAPDIDAIASVWMLKRFDPEHFADAKVAFVDSGKTIAPETANELGFSMENVVHTDTGFGEFDHHQQERATQRVCATSLVYDHVKSINTNLIEDWPLQQMVEYILVDDLFEDYFYADADSVRHLFALRGILHGAEYAGMHDDDSQIQFGFRMLDAIYASLKERWRAMEELKDGTEFTTRWGKSVGVETSNGSVTRYAQLAGYILVIQKDPKRGGVNIKAAPRKEIDLTPLYNLIVKKDAVGDWYFHNGKHMIINSSSKASAKPTPLTLAEVMQLAKAC